MLPSHIYTDIYHFILFLHVKYKNGDSFVEKLNNYSNYKTFLKIFKEKKKKRQESFISLPYLNVTERIKNQNTLLTSHSQMVTPNLFVFSMLLFVLFVITSSSQNLPIEPEDAISSLRIEIEQLKTKVSILGDFTDFFANINILCF